MIRAVLPTLLCASCVLPVDIREGEQELSNRPPVIGSVSPEDREACCVVGALSDCQVDYRVNGVSDEDTEQALRLRWFVYSEDVLTTPGEPVLESPPIEADDTGQRAAPSEELAIADVSAAGLINFTAGTWIIEAVLSDGFAYDEPVSDEGDPQDMRVARSGSDAAHEVWILTIGSADECP